ncbi:MAG: ferrous iron transporter B [Candidatus Cloacimonadota bacterium]|nr:MAG: ferrous iron transporter B [Candidatus Cloacimonadota bacterium]
MRKILLLGNPNVGKSVIFSRLTGVQVIASNYPGTTVEFIRGYMKLGDEKIEIIDVPGTYSLEPTCKAEQVAVAMLKEGDIVINVVDATNLERNLNLTLQLLKTKKPVIIALNIYDEACHTGISIDVEKLERILGVPVIPTCAITAEGIKNLVMSIEKARKGTYDYEDEERWHEVGNIIKTVQKISHRHHRFIERLEDTTIKPGTGIPIALVLLFALFWIIRFIGEGLTVFVLEPLFEKLLAPVMMKLSAFMGSGGFFHNILIGKLVDGRIDFLESFGVLTTGLFVPFAVVLPYIFAFYLILSFLEDSGYLPRLGVLVDNVMHKLGLHGLSIIPIMLAFGCNVPGALATRILETKRERFIAMTLMAIGVPCMAQLAMIIGLVGGVAGLPGLMLVFITLITVWILLGLLLNLFIRGESPEIFVEIPTYRMPYLGALFKKLWMRVKGFLKEAVPFVILGVLVANILYSLHVIDFITGIFAPVVTKVFGLPSEAIAALIIGFLRKDVAVGMLAPLNLSVKQIVIASVILTMYFPCFATFAVMLKELGIKDMLKSAAIMLIATLIVGGVLNLILR